MQSETKKINLPVKFLFSFDRGKQKNATVYTLKEYRRVITAINDLIRTINIASPDYADESEAEKI